MDGWTDGQTNGRMDGWVDGRMDDDSSTRTRAWHRFAPHFHSPRDKVERLYGSDRDVARELVRVVPGS